MNTPIHYSRVASVVLSMVGLNSVQQRWRQRQQGDLMPPICIDKATFMDVEYGPLNTIKHVTFCVPPYDIVRDWHSWCCTNNTHLITCNNCLEKLAKEVGLSKDAPACAIIDKFIEDNIQW